MIHWLVLIGMVLRRSSVARVLGLPVVLLGLIAWPGGEVAAAGSSRPNIVLVLVDDLRWDELGCAGHPFVKTPRIDQIAREGALFLNSFCVTPLCSPDRASILTGLYAHQHGILDNTNRAEASHRLATFPQDLQRAGYETGYIGKWHMGNDATARPGFDYWVSIEGQGETVDPPIFEDGRLQRQKGYITDLFTDRAVAFLERPRAKPFFLYLAHKAIHPNVLQRDDGSVDPAIGSAFIPAQRHKHLYSGAAVPRRPNCRDTLLGKTALQRPIAGLPPLGPETGTPDEVVRDRMRMLAAVEESTGRLLDALQRLGQLENTVFVFTSDNGYFNGEHGLSVERRLAYEESIRIPLLLRYPPMVKPGTRIEQCVLSIDLAPTFLELGGVRTIRPMHGRSLVPLLRGDDVRWRDSFLIEYFSDTVFPRVRSMGYQAVRTDRFKYIHYHELPAMDELYDLQADPYEMKNLIFEPAAQEMVRRMQGELAGLLEVTR